MLVQSAPPSTAEPANLESTEVGGNCCRFESRLCLVSTWIPHTHCCPGLSLMPLPVASMSAPAFFKVIQLEMLHVRVPVPMYVLLLCPSLWRSYSPQSQPPWTATQIHETCLSPSRSPATSTCPRTVPQPSHRTRT